MFFYIFCNIRNSFLSFLHLIIHPIHEWSWFYKQSQYFFIVSNDELLRPCLFLRIDIRSSRSVTRSFLVPNELRGSFETNFLVREYRVELLISFSRKFRQVVPIARVSQYQFSILERTKRGRHPTLSSLLKRSFPKLIMVIVVGSFELVCADIKSPRSLLFLSNWTPGFLTFITSLPRIYWSRGRYVRRRPCNEIHHWSRFCCFAIVSKNTVELKVLILNKHNKRFHSSREKIPFVKLSSSWFLVSMYLIWIFGSGLIGSNNQSSATLWVLETCLIVGLLPFIKILITVSLSSNTYN